MFGQRLCPMTGSQGALFIGEEFCVLMQVQDDASMNAMHLDYISLSYWMHLGFEICENERPFWSTSSMV